jgi:hypothetical protein
MFIVLDFILRVRKSLGWSAIFKVNIPEFRKNVLYEFEINVAYYPIVEIVWILRQPLRRRLSPSEEDKNVKPVWKDI